MLKARVKPSAQGRPWWGTRESTEGQSMPPRKPFSTGRALWQKTWHSWGPPCESANKVVKNWMKGIVAPSVMGESV